MSESSNVIPIGAARSSTTNVRCRRCGGEWWRIVRDTVFSTTPIPGAVVLAEEGDHDRVVGYAGRFICSGCGEAR